MHWSAKVIWFIILWWLSLGFVWLTTQAVYATLSAETPEASFGVYVFVAALGWAIVGLCWLLDRGIYRWENRGTW